MTYPLAKWESDTLDRHLERYEDGPDLEKAGWTCIGKRKDGTHIYRRKDHRSGRCEIKTQQDAREIVEREEQEAYEDDRDDWRDF
jgi:hypothetical protein